jgi:hypothetical protein
LVAGTAFERRSHSDRHQPALAGSSLLVDVQLVDTSDGRIAWGDRFSTVAENILKMQREIASKIAGSLHAGLRETEKHAILGAPPRNLDVYALTLRGIAQKHQFNPEATRAGREDLEEAIRRDPNYAPAHGTGPNQLRLETCGWLQA